MTVYACNFGDSNETGYGNLTEPVSSSYLFADPNGQEKSEFALSPPVELSVSVLILALDYQVSE